MHPLPDFCEKTVITEAQIQTRIAELGQQISADYSQLLKQGEEVVVIAILKGAYMFAADLSRKITVPNSVDFMAVSSYGKGTTSTGEVKIIMDTKFSIHNKHVLILEDILDSGLTLAFIQTLLKTRKPASLKSCVLLDKHKSSYACDVHYSAFDISQVPTFVIGYGLDLGERYRHLPYIACLKQSFQDDYLNGKK